MKFKEWLENQLFGGGLEPPKQQPTQEKGAFPIVNNDDLPPTLKRKKIKK